MRCSHLTRIISEYNLVIYHLLYLKFKFSSQKGLFIPRDNMIFRRDASPFSSFRAESVILNIPLFLNILYFPQNLWQIYKY